MSGLGPFNGVMDIKKNNACLSQLGSDIRMDLEPILLGDKLCRHQGFNFM